MTDIADWEGESGVTLTLEHAFNEWGKEGARADRLALALMEIAALGDDRCDEAAVVARRALDTAEAA